MTRIWPLVLFYNTIDVSTINALIIWQGINHANGNIRMRQKRTFLISLGKELCGITEEAQSVVLIFATRKRNVILAGNGALLNKGPDVLCVTERRTKNVNLFVLNVANMYVLNTRTLFATTVPVITITIVIIFILFVFIASGLLVCFEGYLCETYK